MIYYPEKAIPGRHLSRFFVRFIPFIYLRLYDFTLYGFLPTTSTEREREREREWEREWEKESERRREGERARGGRGEAREAGKERQRRGNINEIPDFFSEKIYNRQW
jgi:hypothetical protein